MHAWDRDSGRRRGSRAKAGVPTVSLRNAETRDDAVLLKLWRELMDLHVSLDPRFTLAEAADQAFLAYAEAARTRDDYRIRVAELKGQVAARRNAPGASPDPEAIARTLHLRVVNGTVQIPDVRLEYETREGTMARVDLELATEHYKPSQVAAKVQAGFTIYAPASQTDRLTAALEDRGVIGEILSL